MQMLRCAQHDSALQFDWGESPPIRKQSVDQPRRFVAAVFCSRPNFRAIPRQFGSNPGDGRVRRGVGHDLEDSALRTAAILRAPQNWPEP